MTARNPRESRQQPSHLAQVYCYLTRRNEEWLIYLLLLAALVLGILAYLYKETVPKVWLPNVILHFAWMALLGLIFLMVLLNVSQIEKKRQLRIAWHTANLEQEKSLRGQERVVLDTLTGTYGRRFFEEIVNKEARRSNRYGRPLSLVLIKLSELTKINQQHGHLVGDEVLRGVGRLLNRAFRASDYIFRFGGGQFMVLLPDTPAEGAAVVARGLQHTLRNEADFTKYLGRPFVITISQGTYVWPASLEEVIEQVELKVQITRIGRDFAKEAGSRPSQ